MSLDVLPPLDFLQLVTVITGSSRLRSNFCRAPTKTISDFWSGFNDIASEMARVIRGGGYLFLTFPVMSSLRKWIARHKNYQKWEGKETEPDGFYQFALDSKSIIQHFTSLGFEVIHSRGFDGVKGIKDEISLIKPLLQKIYDSQNISAKLSRKIIDLSFSHYCGHSILLVLHNFLSTEFCNSIFSLSKVI